jgi:uncharacterized protein YkwD
MNTHSFNLMTRALSILFVTCFLFNSFAQNLSEEEQRLYDLVMEYRDEKGLPEIPLSPSLTIVAQTHVKDLMENDPTSDECNLHSWSSKGNWTPCCYTDDHAQAEKMWSKPSELTSYSGNGYEIASYFWSSDPSVGISASQALNQWKNSSGHNAVITNKSIWKNYNWQAIGVGINGNYAVIWFGEESDPAQ